MRVAVLSDIHGNRSALEAVLADVEHEDVDAIVVAGDSVSGPWPAEVFDLLAAVDARVIRGNADRLDEVARHDEHLGAWTADWALFGPDVELRRTEYDVEAAVGAMRTLGAPVQEQLRELLIDPLDSESATAEFERLRGA